MKKAIFLVTAVLLVNQTCLAEDYSSDDYERAGMQLGVELLSSLFSGELFGTGSSSASSYESTTGVRNTSLNTNSYSTRTYDVWCNNGSHGYVVINDAYISWTGNGSDGSSTPYKVSFNEAANKICQ